MLQDMDDMPSGSEQDSSSESSPDEGTIHSTVKGKTKKKGKTLKKKEKRARVEIEYEHEYETDRPSTSKAQKLTI